MVHSQPMLLSKDEKIRLLDWWKTMESAKPVIRKLMSLITELRLNKEASHAGGIILLYRAASEISYGYSGVRGCIRRALTSEYSESLRINMTMCHSFAPKFSVDTKVLLKRVAKEIKGQKALQIIKRIQETLVENDFYLKEIEDKAKAFFGRDTFNALNHQIKQANTMS
jgi:hypothetical protein